MRDEDFWYYVGWLEDVDPPGRYLVARGRKTWGAYPIPEHGDEDAANIPELLYFWSQIARFSAERVVA